MLLIVMNFRNIVPHVKLDSEKVNENVLKVQRWCTLIADAIEGLLSPHHPRHKRPPLAYLQHLSLTLGKEENECNDILRRHWEMFFSTPPPLSFSANDLFALGRAMVYRCCPNASEAERESEEALSELISGFYPLALQVASAYAAKVTHMPLEELQAEAISGIITAIDYFNPAEGKKFSTYLVPTLCSHVRDAIGRSFYGFRIPASSWRIYMRAREKGDPSPISFAISLENDSEDVEEDRAVDILTRSVAETAWEENSLRQDIADVVERLPEPLRIIITRYFWEDEDDLKAIAEELGLSYAVTRELFQLAMAILRYCLKE